MQRLASRASNMSYQSIYYNVPGAPVPQGSRAVASLYGGSICPSRASFGRSHGSSPARGSVSLEGAPLIPAGSEVVIQIGFSVFYGLAIHGEVDNSIQTGNNTTFHVVDYRDRLHDINHFAQYNMVDSSGLWWHIMPSVWDQQQPVYIAEVELTPSGNLEPNLDLLLDGEELKLFTSFELLNFFGHLYEIEFSASDTALEKLENYIPDNLDFNRGRKVIDCIAEIVEKSSLQFTAWGNLNIHITERGVADNQFEENILSGNVDLCGLGGYVSASLGMELNDRGRRVIVLGGRNQYENWYPCYPDWPLTWTWEMCNDIGFEFSALLAKNELTRLNLVGSLPNEFKDPRKFNGHPRNEMTIKDYIEQIPFKTYIASYQTVVKEKNADNPFNTERYFESQVPEDEEEEVPEGEEADGFEDFEHLVHDESTIDGYGSFLEDFPFPLSNKLISDSSRQFIVKAISRKLKPRGQDGLEGDTGTGGNHFEIQGWTPPFVDIDEGVSLEIEEYIPAEEYFASKEVIKKYRVKLLFAERRFQLITEEDEVPAVGDEPAQPFTRYNFSPDHVYVKLSLDKELYTYEFGEAGTAVRVRETVYEVNEIRKCTLDFEEVPFVAANFTEEGLASLLEADDVAEAIAQRFLNHEIISSSGHIAFRTVAGYMPSGIIDSVNVTFDNSRGVREVINFSNVRNDPSIPTYIPMSRTVNPSNAYQKWQRDAGKESFRVREAFQAEANEAMKNFNKAAQARDAHTEEENVDHLGIAQNFGGNRNAAEIAVKVKNMPAQILNGDVLILDDLSDVE